MSRHRFVLAVLLALMVQRECQAGFILDLGGVEGRSGYSTATFLNERGDVVGDAKVGAAQTMGFIYRDGKTQTVILNDADFHFFSINSDGVAVGRSGTTGVIYRDSQVVAGPHPDGTAYYYAGINDSGMILGNHIPNYMYDYVAFLHLNGVETILPGLAEDRRIEGTAINQRGQVTGVAVNGSKKEHAFFFDGITTHDLGTLSGDGGTSLGLGINLHGDIVGVSDGQAFLYRSGMMTPIEGLETTVGETRAQAINDSGVIVGWTITSKGKKAFVHQDGVTLDLNSLVPDSGWTLLEAHAINNQGQIVGIGINSKCETRAFLYTPHHAPEPGSLTLMAIGACGLRFRRRWTRRRNPVSTR